MPEKYMTSSDVVDLYTGFDNLGITIWIDGGWGVDGLLGEQTRPHEDLDIVIQQKDLSQACQFLEERGYKDVKRDDTSRWNFAMSDNHGHEIDIHVIVLDEQGNGIYGPRKRGETYPADSLTGVGKITGHKVNCISLEYMLKFHTGYRRRFKDFKDIAALCEKFGIECSEDYLNQ